MQLQKWKKCPIQQILRNRENDKMIYKFIVEFYGEKLFDWSKKERLLQLPTRKNPQMYFVNLRAVTRLFDSEKPELINCIAEEGVRFKRAISGSTRQKKYSNGSII